MPGDTPFLAFKGPCIMARQRVTFHECGKTVWLDLKSTIKTWPFKMYKIQLKYAQVRLTFQG